MKTNFTPLNRNLAYLFLLLLAVLVLPVKAQMSHNVDVTNNVFTPDQLTVSVGDTVIWTNSQGFHNVNGTQASYPSNPESFGNGTGTGWTFNHVFTIPGTYDYQCDPHVGLGMIGQVIVESLGGTLTINFSGMTPHVGQTLWLLVEDRDESEEILRMSRVIEESFAVEVPGIVAGNDYRLEFFADHNGNGSYDDPPTDHAWRYDLDEVSETEVLDFAHNTDFQDIDWDHKVVLNLSGMTPHVGQEIYFALIDAVSGEVIDRESEIVSEAFSVELTKAMTDRAYYVDFFSDHNSNGYYDAPPTDHAWRLEFESTAGDDTLDFVHNTNFTDVMWKHRLRVRFSGMTPHVGQMLTLYVRDAVSGVYLDTVVIESIEDADFDMESHVVEPGNSYLIDFYADHNGNGSYDAPPTDHSWRIETGVAMGDVELNFTHNMNFTDISTPLGPNILLSEDAELGLILTDAEGFTLYYFTKDALPDTSLCTGNCVINWPLFYVENVELGEGLDIADFGSIEHPEGGMQTTYKGWPLYYWKNDQNPGETTGEGVGNVWFVAKPDYSVMLMDGYLTGKDGVTYNSMYEPGEEMVQYFVDENGQSLYVFINDSYDQNNFTNEDFSNNSVWPIYEEELQSVPSTLDKSMFGSIEVYSRNQLTYNGWPLYYFGEDSLRGDVTGVSVPSPGVWPVAVQGLEAAPEVTSTEDFNAHSDLLIYPNPALDVLNIDSESEIESLTIINVMGSRIRKVSGIGTMKYELQLDEIQPGMYFIEVRSSDDEIQINRFIKR